ncbi:hypothetical protein DFH06DRAFT_1477266 [Mycena polygramma]|nr:hypothetical protein DFH06DRAFT_1477266 [Mycena polygramma]
MRHMVRFHKFHSSSLDAILSLVVQPVHEQACQWPQTGTYRSLSVESFSDALEALGDWRRDGGLASPGAARRIWNWNVIHRTESSRMAQNIIIVLLFSSFRNHCSVQNDMSPFFSGRCADFPVPIWPYTTFVLLVTTRSPNKAAGYIRALAKPYKLPRTTTTGTKLQNVNVRTSLLAADVVAARVENGTTLPEYVTVTVCDSLAILSTHPVASATSVSAEANISVRRKIQRDPGGSNTIDARVKVAGALSRVRVVLGSMMTSEVTTATSTYVVAPSAFVLPAEIVRPSASIGIPTVSVITVYGYDFTTTVTVP